MQFNRSLIFYFKYILSVLIFLCVLLFFKSRSSSCEQTTANAYIISSNCQSARFQYTKANLQRVFPDFFSISCFQLIDSPELPVDHQSSYTDKSVFSHVLSFLTLLTEEIANEPGEHGHRWSFVFQDNINFVDPAVFALENYLQTTRELIHDFDIRTHDGVLYLGIAQPAFVTDHYGLVSSFSNSSLFSSKGFGLGTYAMGFTKKFARTFASQMFSYVTTSNQPVDMYVKNYCLASGKRYFVLGSNVRPTSSANYFGIAYPDQQRFPTGTW